MLFTVQDSENYRKHKETLLDTDRTMDTLTTKHLRKVPKGNVVHMKEERQSQIQRDNRNLFQKIEAIINRPRPYKLQPSKNNNKKVTKVYHAPSDNLITSSTILPRPTFNITHVKQEQRDS